VSGLRLQSGLFLRERLPRGEPRGIVLFVHGATVGSVLFDLPAPGLSILDACAADGWAAYAVDLRGYGRSTRSSAMDLPPHLCPLQCTGADAIEDIRETVEFTLHRRQSQSLTLVGGSWGSLTSARFAITNPTTIRRLILLAPLYTTRNKSWLDLLADPSNPTRINPALGGYRFTTAYDLLSRWDPEIGIGDPLQRRDPMVFAALLRAELEGDSKSPRKDAFRVPNGTLHELFEVFSGRPIYDAADITCPTVLIRGARDLTSTAQDMAQLEAKIAGAPVRSLTIPDAGHFMQAEHAAPILHRSLLRLLRSDTRALDAA
jgi:pimeloyl-ACP methyl ester carboxylesterase